MKYGALRVSLSGNQVELPIEQSSLIVGRAEGSGIHLDDSSVSRRHARLTTEGGHLIVEDLGSATGVYVGGQRIPPGTPTRVEPGSSLRFGSVEATFEASEPETPPATSSAPAAGAAPVTPSSAPRRLDLTVTPSVITVEPGSQASIEVQVASRSPVIDAVTLTLEGLPPGWSPEPAKSVRIRPGEQATEYITVAPPRSPDATAGDHPITVLAQSEASGTTTQASAVLTVAPFADAQLELRPPRGTSKFSVVATNLGNSAAVFRLDGRDDEDALDYVFSSPTLTVGPGTQESVDVTVRNPNRGMLGAEQFKPFQVTAARTDIPGDEQVLTAQLRSVPPLERYKWPGIAVLAILLLIAGGVLAWMLFGGGDDEPIPADETPTEEPTETATVEGSPTPDAVEAVHLCAEPPEARPRAYTVQLPSAFEDGFVGFAQNDVRWGPSEYANAQTSPLFDIGCGTSLANCGCALSSMATVMALFNLVVLPDGSELTPRTLNDWYTQNARLTAGGWVSLGFVFGNVQWEAVNDLSRQLHEIDESFPRLRFVRRGSGTEAEIRGELEQGHPVILNVPGHFIVATGIASDGQIIIHDPYYADRVRLSAYAGQVLGSRIFEPLDPTQSAKSVVVTVPSTARVRIHEAGREDRAVGTLQDVPVSEFLESMEATLPGATVDVESAWRDPMCEFSEPSDDQGTIRIVLDGNSDYTLEVVDPAGGTPSWSYHRYDRNGRLIDMEAGDGGGTTIPAIEDEETPTVEEETPTATNTVPGPTATFTNTPTPTSTPTPTPTFTATPTHTPTVTNTPIPSITLELLSQEPSTGYYCGDIITVRWTSTVGIGGGYTITVTNPNQQTIDVVNKSGIVAGSRGGIENWIINAISTAGTHTITMTTANKLSDQVTYNVQFAPCPLE